MSEPINDGGAAFPRASFTPGCHDNDTLQHTAAAQAGFASTKQDGMSMRDFFAAAALTGLIAAKNVETHDLDLRVCDALGKTIFIAESENAFAYADAMLREREKGGAK